MTDADRSPSQSTWRWLIQRIRISGLPLVLACALWWLAFTVHPAGRYPWLYRTTLIASAILATLQLAYTLRFGKRLD